MKKTELLGTATSPDGTVLTLYRHDGAYGIKADGVELMSTRRHNSEDALADLACAPLRDARAVRVLIGGLGLGFTLKTALRLLGPDARVVVAEIMAEVIAWNQDRQFGLSADALADPRVELRHEDVARTMKGAGRRFDAIMLDVDNGAEAMTTAGNAQLYRSTGIELAIAALKPGGRLAYWSAHPDAGFEQSLGDAGLEVRVSRVRAHESSGPWHTLYVGQRSASVHHQERP